LQLADPAELGYLLRWPIHGGNFNTRDYSSNQMILSDIEVIISSVLQERFDITSKNYKVNVDLLDRLFPLT
jgi:actin-related protein 8